MINLVFGTKPKKPPIEGAILEAGRDDEGNIVVAITVGNDQSYVILTPAEARDAASKIFKMAT